MYKLILSTWTEGVYTVWQLVQTSLLEEDEVHVVKAVLQLEQDEPVYVSHYIQNHLTSQLTDSLYLTD